MAARTSLTGVAVSDGYDQLLHVSDSDGMHATTLRQIYDGDGTASALYLAGERVKIVLGTDSADDFAINDGTRNLVLVEGDLAAVTIRGDNSAGSDFIVEDSVGTDLFTVATDTQSVTVGLDGSAGADFLVETTAGTDIFLLESDTLKLTAVLDLGVDITIGTTAGDDLTVSDGTRDVLTIEGDKAAVTVKGSSASGSDFIVEDSAGTDLFTVETDTMAVAFRGDSTAGSDFLIEDSAGGDIFLVETDTGHITFHDGAYNFDIASHDATTGLKLGGVVVAATAAEINANCDVLTTALTTTKAVADTETGTHFVLNSTTAFVSTLPAVAAGLEYWFHAGAAQPTGGNHTVYTNAGANVIHGKIASAEDAAGSVVCHDDADTISFVADLTIQGDYVHLWCDGTSWFIDGMCDVQDGMTTTQAA